MAWLSTPGAPTVEESSVHAIVNTFATFEGPKTYYRIDTTTTVAYNALTKAAADALAAELAVEHPRNTVFVRKQNDGGAYRVTMTERSVASWVGESE